jgi:hypothetical protein
MLAVCGEKYVGVQGDRPRKIFHFEESSTQMCPENGKSRRGCVRIFEKLLKTGAITENFALTGDRKGTRSLSVA